MTKIITETVKVSIPGNTLELLYSFPLVQKEQPLPAILVLHPWSGRDSFTCDKSTYFATKGFLGIAVDLFGGARIGKTSEECQALIEPFINNRTLLKTRLQQVMEHVQQDPRVDSNHINAIGYCFGGLCVLDMVRNNLGLRSGISVHGLLNKPNYTLPDTYSAKVLAIHGHKDPLVPPQQVTNFQTEMTESVSDWQMIVFGQGMHAFTRPGANDEAMGLFYNPLLDQRTTKAVNGFLEEISQ